MPHSPRERPRVSLVVPAFSGGFGGGFLFVPLEMLIGERSAEFVETILVVDHLFAGISSRTGLTPTSTGA